jgi:putative ABC transport system permease protein
MSWLEGARARLRLMFARGDAESRMDEEFRFHIDMATDRLVREKGLDPVEARRQALVAFGGVDKHAEDLRDDRGLAWLETFVGDTRFALRYFARHKATVAIIVLVLAIGTGANTMIFSVFQSQFLRPAPALRADDAHARLWSQQRDTRLGAWHERGFTYPELLALAQRKDAFSDVAGWTRDAVSLSADSGAASVASAQYVTPNYFATLGVRPIAGQGLSRQATEGPDRTAVLSEAAALRLYGSANDAIGRTIHVNEVPLRVVGVAPSRFQGAAKNMGSNSLWIPLSARADIAHISPRWLTEEPSLSVVARVEQGVRRDQASALATQVVSGTLPDSAARVGMARTATVQSMHAPPPSARRDLVKLFVAAGAIGVLILLVGWMNVSSLMVAAAVARRHEIAVRLSMGASRLRILRQLVTESTILAIGGGLLGSLIAWWVLVLLNINSGLDTVPDGMTFLFTLLLAVTTGILFGLSPAFHATRGQLASAMRDAQAGGVGRARLQRGFVGAQIMLSQPLLVLLGVMISLIIYVFEPHAASMSAHVIKAEFQPLQQTGGPGQRREAVDSLVPRIAQLPEVRGALHEARPFEARTVKAADASAGSALTLLQLVGAQPGWMALTDIPLMIGRDVAWSDTASAERPVVIGSDLARKLWGDANPIGRRLASPPRRGTEQDSIALTVVGVYDASHRLTDAAWEGEHGDSTPHAITAHGKHWRADEVLVRTHRPAEAFLPELRGFVRAQAPSLVVAQMRTLQQVDQDAYDESVNVSLVFAAGGLVALLLASLGLYGVVSLAVQQRTREIGIRIAVGGRPQAVARMFVAAGVKVGAIGLILGLPLSMAALKVAKSQGAIDDAPGVNVGMIGAVITLLLLAVAAAAAWLPARRAAQVDPAATLRVE